MAYSSFHLFKVDATVAKVDYSGGFSLGSDPGEEKEGKIVRVQTNLGYFLISWLRYVWHYLIEFLFSQRIASHINQVLKVVHERGVEQFGVLLREEVEVEKSA